MNGLYRFKAIRTTLGGKFEKGIINSTSNMFLGKQVTSRVNDGYKNYKFVNMDY